MTHYGDWGFETNHPARCTYDGNKRDVCQPRRFKPLPHHIYRNKGDGTFTDITRQLQLREDGKGLGVVIVDFDGDGRPDIYVANDTDDNFLYMNESKRGAFKFNETGLFATVARDERGTANGSMGVDAGDPNRSGKPSLIVTNYENELPAYYENLCEKGKASFNYSTTTAGIGAIGGVHVGWGVGFFDLDNDGWEDLLMVNGHAIRYPKAEFGRKQKAVLMVNRQDGRFRAVTSQGGDYFRTEHNARGVAVGDLDNDGRVDMVVSHLNEPVVVLRNIAPQKHWIGLKLTGAKGRSIVGARVVLEGPNGTQTRFVKGGGSYASSRDPRLHFGLDTGEKVKKVSVHWPWGEVQEWEGPAIDAYWRLTEGKKEPERPKSDI